jgi:adenine-specific DNA-methyltransferase
VWGEGLSYEVLHGDCREVMAGMDANSVDAIVTDPPYFKVKGEAWDRQWDKPDQFIAWLGEVADEWYRILKPNGSLYCFASPRMAARVEVMLGERFNVCNHIVWSKPPFSTKAEMFRKPDLRSFFPSSERIIFADHYGSDNIAKGEAGYVAKCDELRGFLFEPLRAYLEGEWSRAGLRIEDANTACGTSTMANHYFHRAQWALPTRENYTKLQAWAGSGYLRREWDELKAEYEHLRRPFSVTADVPYTDVWSFPTVQHYPGKHVCEKPQQLLEHIINASTRPGDTVLDCFAGSGSTGEACRTLGRSFIGIEMDEAWANKARERVTREDLYAEVPA